MKVIANTRTTQGTGASRRLRHTGKVPGVIYGGKAEVQAIEVEHNPLYHALRKEKFHASILDLELDGKGERVLLRAFQMHPYKPLVMHIDFQRVAEDQPIHMRVPLHFVGQENSPEVMHIDFQRVAEDQPIHMRVPLHFVGQENSPAVKVTGGLVNHVMSEVDVACLPKDLPEYVEVDLSELKANDTVRVRDIKMPAGVKPVLKGNENPVVASVSTHGEVAEEEVVAGAPVAAEVPATAQKAPPTAAAPAGKDAKGGKDGKKK